MARPIKYTKAIRNMLKRKFEKYIEETEIPILCEFAYQNNVPSTSLYDFEELSTLRKKCTDKKQAALESMALHNKVNTTMAVFSLKQMGWSDKTETINQNRNININQVDEKQLDEEIDKLLDLRNIESNQDKIKEKMKKGILSNEDINE